VAECDAIIAACHAAGVRLTVGYRLHYEPHHAELARLARENVFGAFTRMKGKTASRWARRTPIRTHGASARSSRRRTVDGHGVYVIQAVCMAKVEAAPVAVTAKFGPVTRPKLFSEVESRDLDDGVCRRGAGEMPRDLCDAVSRFRADAERGWRSSKTRILL